MRDFKDPYLAVQDPKIMMAGAGAPRSTVFGVLGRTMGGSSVGAKSLGGLVTDTKTAVKAHVATMKESRAPQTERKIIGHKSKTSVPGAHMGMVPYPGFFMVAIGKRL
jgi:hypothetical protein